MLQLCLSQGLPATPVTTIGAALRKDEKNVKTYNKYSSSFSSEPSSRRDSLVREVPEKAEGMGVNLKEEENLDQGEEENIERGQEGQDNLEEVEEEGREKVSNDNILSPPEDDCAEQPVAGGHPVEADIKSEETSEKVLEEPEKEKLGDVVDDEALGADWGLVINQADASEKHGGSVNLDNADVVPCEEPMEVVEDEAVPDIIEKEEESVNQENEL